MSINDDVRLKPNNAKISEKIRGLMKANKLNDSQLAELSGFSRTYINGVRNGAKEAPLELLMTLKKSFGVSIDDMVFDDAPYKSVESNIVEEPTPKYEHKGLPYYGDIVATGGTSKLFTDSAEYPTSYILAPGFEDCDGALSITGESMSPKIRHGDIVLCKREEKPYLFLFGEIYLVITRSYRTIKYVRRSDLADHIKLCSENPDHDPIEIALIEVLHLYRIRGTLSRFS
jgi:phage repressor protein C with HTH and peptisase S24 domain